MAMHEVSVNNMRCTRGICAEQPQSARISHARWPGGDRTGSALVHECCEVLVCSCVRRWLLTARRAHGGVDASVTWRLVTLSSWCVACGRAIGFGGVTGGVSACGERWCRVVLRAGNRVAGDTGRCVCAEGLCALVSGGIEGRSRGRAC